MFNVVPQSEYRALLDLLLPHYPITSNVHLYKNNIQPTNQTVLGDFVEADYDGYASESLTAWGATFLNGDGNAESVAPNITFTCTGDTTPNIVYGYYITDAADAVLLMSGKFDAPETMNSAANAFVFLPDYELAGIAN